jgi:hypothetical protein
VLKPLHRKKSICRHHGFEQNLKIKKIIALDGVKTPTQISNRLVKQFKGIVISKIQDGRQSVAAILDFVFI